MSACENQAELVLSSAEAAQQQSDLEMLAVKYFLYASKSKIDMLAAQIPTAKWRSLTASLKVDLKVVSVSVEKAGADSDVFSKLHLLEHYLSETDQIGSISDSKAYFSASLPMKSALIRSARVKAEYLYFGGFADDRLIALVGSPGHLIGGVASPNELHERMASAYLVPMITRCLGDSQSVDDESSAGRLERLSESDLGYFIGTINNRIPEPAQELQFVAKRLASSDGDRAEAAPFLLGTPLYLALAN